MNKTDSQNNLILNHLLSGKSITSWDSIQLFRCTRLSARIWDLRHKGYRIEEVDTELNGKRFARYFLATEQEEAVAQNNLAQETAINFKATQMAFM